MYVAGMVRRMEMTVRMQKDGSEVIIQHNVFSVNLLNNTVKLDEKNSNLIFVRSSTSPAAGWLSEGSHRSETLIYNIKTQSDFYYK